MIEERGDRVSDEHALVCDEYHCITCGDDGIPMTVVRIDGDRDLALCADADGEHHTVEIALVEPVSPGERILVHAGTAIANLGPEEDNADATGPAATTKAEAA